MPRCLAQLFAVLALFACVAPALAQGPLPCSAGGGLTVRGRLLDPAGPQDGVACCLVQITVVYAPGDSDGVRIRTRADGTFSACFDCRGQGPIDISFLAFCCGASAQQSIPSCVDPGGLPVHVDLGDITCPNAPDTNMTALMGSVLCRSGALLEPVADCAILVDAIPSRNGIDNYSLTRTDVNGDYETCLPCGVGGGAIIVNGVEAQCCGQSERPDVIPCEERHRVPTMICDPCPVPPCNLPEEIEIRGRLDCDLDGDGDVDPVGGCVVTLTLADPFAVRHRVTVTTNPNGVYSACVPCPADDGLGSWTLIAEPECCSDTFTQQVNGCPPIVDMGSLFCCPSGGGCPAFQTRVRGRVTCDVPGGDRPIEGCPITIRTLGCQPDVQTFTDANGAYSACVNCAGCSEVTVVAECCREMEIAPLDCTSESVVDLSCGACPPGPPCPGEQEVRGRVTCLDPAGAAEPVAGCDVVVSCPGNTVLATTDANGEYLACLPCNQCPEISVVACCGASAILTPSPNCTPLTADLDCGRCAPPQPCPGEQEVRGRVTCTDLAGQPQAVAGCDVRVECASNPNISTTVTTDAAGNYVACLPCGACTVVRATALCCNASTLMQLSPTCPPVTADISCGPCTPPPNPCSPEQTIAGRVTCDANGDGVQDPLAGCSVRVECLGVPGFTTIVTTDGSGEYVACIPCTTCTTARVTALCCGAVATVTLTPPNCVPVRADLACMNCPPPSPCGPSEQAIFGRVTCRDAGGQRVPQVGCDVRVECAGVQPVTATTDVNGDYVACLPCGACAFVIVTPSCCGSPVTVQLNPVVCLPVRQDIDCGACVPPRPCPGPLATAVNGALICRQNGAPLAGSIVILQALDAGGNPLPGVATAQTDGAGQYRACVPCPNGIASIRATSQGCNVSSEGPALGCPETLSLGVMECDNCSPCPQGSTRLQGQIQCRGGGPVANCAIRVVVDTCGQVLVFDAQADANGKYRLCIPCPCNDSDIRVTALCCNASRAFHVDRCGPITPVPTLYCPSPCR